MSKTSRKAIVAAAGDLLRERGFAGMSMKDLADRVGLLKGSLYSHFPGKAALVPEVLARIALELSGSMESEGEEEGEWLADYRHALDALCDHLVRNGKCTGLHLLYGLGETEPAARRAVEQFFAAILARLTAILARGMAPDPAAELARDSLAWLEGCTLWTVLEGNVAPIRAARAALIARAGAWGQAVDDPAVRDLLDRTMGDWRRASMAERELAERVIMLEARSMNMQAALAGQVEADSCFR